MKHTTSMFFSIFCGFFACKNREAIRMAKVKDSHTNTATGTEEKKPSLIANGAAAFTVEVIPC